MKKIIAAAVILLLASAATVLAEVGTVKRIPKPDEYGNVDIDNYSQYSGMAPVVFEHWLHRSIYTCRVCHVDLGFALKADATEIRAADNEKGYYCGACHNGKMEYKGEKIFAACSTMPRGGFEPADIKRCERCHSKGRYPDREFDFYTFTKGFPKARFGNGINWMKAEEEGKIKLIDFIPGISIERPKLGAQQDVVITPTIKGMPKVLFSHDKHTVWNGCELCHPELFTVKNGASHISMVDIFQGKFCGACHGKVSFPLIDCQRCHEFRRR
ncbi:MAG: hypothetical protein M0018_01860 [Nitrospiraceae bacterium]|nr:hypothetical protein [Nitrospiraceae bacterium]